MLHKSIIFARYTQKINTFIRMEGSAPFRISSDISLTIYNILSALDNHMHNRTQCKVVVEARDTTFFYTKDKIFNNNRICNLYLDWF